ncbi:MAG: glucose-6-phosphate isomerase, partial [Ilumatobacteraceae bacterium]
MSLDAIPEWATLLSRPARPSIRSMFADDPERAARFSFDVGDLFVDLSKHRWDEQLRDDLVAVARVAGVLEARDRLFDGDRLNVSEDRPVGHLAQRAPQGDA